MICWSLLVMLLHSKMLANPSGFKSPVRKSMAGSIFSAIFFLISMSWCVSASICAMANSWSSVSNEGSSLCFACMVEKSLGFISFRLACGFLNLIV